MFSRLGLFSYVKKFRLKLHHDCRKPQNTCLNRIHHCFPIESWLFLQKTAENLPSQHQAHKKSTFDAPLLTETQQSLHHASKDLTIAASCLLKTDHHYINSQNINFCCILIAENHINNLMLTEDWVWPPHSDW